MIVQVSAPGTCIHVEGIFMYMYTLSYLILFLRPASLLDGRISAVEPAMKALAMRETMANIISNCRYMYDGNL